MTIDAAILPHVAALESYVVGRPISSVARDFGLDPHAIIKLASNENALGMSPAARQVIAHLATDPSRYPDSDSFDLRARLSQQLAIDADRIMLGSGSSQLILLAARAFLCPGRAAVVSQYAFVSYASAVRSVGARVITVPARAWGHDLAQMRAAVTNDVHVVFIASPNNPTGTMVAPDALAQVIRSMPEHVLIVLDEAYRDYVEPDQRPDINVLISQHRNLLVLRTFSKVYGLAGLRVGYCLGAAGVVNVLKRLQLPFSVNTLAQAAASAALEDREFVEHSVDLNSEQRMLLGAGLQSRGFEYLPSHGNFLPVRVGDGPRIFQMLLRKGVVVRSLANYGLSEWIRVSIGLHDENRVFLQRLCDLLPAGTPRGSADTSLGAIARL